MRASIPLAALIALPLSLNAQPQDRHGYYWVTDSFFDGGADPTGVDDSSTQIQKAADRAMKDGRALYFPLGTYKISKTIQVTQDPKISGGDCAGHAWNFFPVIMVGEKGANGERPLIQLANGSPLFNESNKADALPMIHIRFLADGEERTNCGFANVFRGINLDVGNNNAGAVGIRFGNAQESFISDVDIDATGGYAGMFAFPGRGGYARNVKITGGRYGIDLDDYGEGGATGGHLVHITLINQTDAAMIDGVGRGMAVMGMEIRKPSGTMIITDYEGSTNGHLAFYDAKFEFTGSSGGTVFNNADDISLVLKNSWVKGADVLVDNPIGSEDVSVSTGSWTRINDYAHTSNKTASWNLINGSRTTADITNFTTNSAPPADYRDSHYWAGPPDYRASGVVNAVTASGGTVVPNDGNDDAPGLQNLINNNNVIFLPRGIYNIDTPLQLKANTVLFGVPGRRSGIRPSYDSLGSFAMTTVNDANATTVLSDVVFMNETGTNANLNGSGTWKTGALHWRAGRNSVVANTRDAVGINAADSDASRFEQAPVKIFQISGNGGGRWFGVWDHAFSQTTVRADPQFRKIYVTGTSEPLSIYGPNPEHGGSKSSYNDHEYFIEVNNSSNVRLLGVKIEGDGPMFLIKDSTNVLIATSFVKPENSSFPLVEVDGGSKIEAHLLAWPQTGAATGGRILNEINHGSGNDFVARDDTLVFYRRNGALDWNAFAVGSGGGGGGNNAPTVATAASANPSPVNNASTTTLSVLGADDNGEANLSYTWSTTAKPSGAANPTFSVNGSNAAKSTVATFSANGSYTFQVTIQDQGGLSTTSSTSVNVTLPVVNQAPTVATAASASPSNVVGASTTQLSVLGADDAGEANLTYTWAATSKPSGAADPTYSANGTNGAKSTTATFFASGSYTLRATIRDQAGLTVTSSVNVSVTLPSGGTTTTFNSTESVELREANPTTNYGSATTLVVGGASGGFKKESLIKVTASGLSGNVTNATLRLALDSTNTAVGDTITVYQNATTSWAENTVTWSTKPAYGNLITTFTVSSTTGTIDINVTSGVTGNGTYSFHLVTTGTQNNKFVSDDASPAPQLVVTTQPATSTTISRTVSSSADDDEDGQGTTSGDLELGNRWVGARFTNITIPKNATILSAKVTFQEETGVVNPASVVIYGDDVNNSADFVAGTQPSARTRTSASVAWNNITSVDNIDSPDIKTIIQEIVNRSGWSSGNAISILFSNGGGRTDAASYDYAEADGPTLEITYQ